MDSKLIPIKSQDIKELYHRYLLDLKLGLNYPSSEFMSLILDDKRIGLDKHISVLKKGIKEGGRYKIDHSFNNLSKGYLNQVTSCKTIERDFTLKLFLFGHIFKFWSCFKTFSKLNPSEARRFQANLHRMKNLYLVADSEIDSLLRLTVGITLPSTKRKTEKAFIEDVKESVWNHSKLMFRNHSEIASAILHILFLDPTGKGVSPSSLSQKALRKAKPVKK